MAIDLRNGTNGTTVGTTLAGVGTDGVRFTRIGVTFGANSTSSGSGFSLSAREPTDDDPTDALAVLDVGGEYGNLGSIDAETVRFSLGADALPNGSSRADVILYRCHNGEWQRVPVTPDGGSFVASVSGVSPIAVGLRENASNAGPGRSNGTAAETTKTLHATASVNHTVNTTVGGTTIRGTTLLAERRHDSTSPAFTQQVDSSGQPGFGVVVSLVSILGLVVLARKRQRL